MLRHWAMFAGLALTLAVTAEPLAAGKPAVTIDGRELCPSARPIVVNNVVFIPARAVLTAAGAEVRWGQAQHTITVRRGEITLMLTVGSTDVVRNGRRLTLPAPVQVMQGMIYAPAVEVARLLGLEAAYEPSAAVLTISGAGQIPPVRPAAITHVFPPEGSTGKSPDRVSVLFELRREGGVDFDSARLFLDGRDVTAFLRRAGTDDIPQSQGELSFDVRPALAPGMHRAMVTYRAGQHTRQYAWTFHVQRC